MKRRKFEPSAYRNQMELEAIEAKMDALESQAERPETKTATANVKVLESDSKKMTVAVFAGKRYSLQAEAARVRIHWGDDGKTAHLTEYHVADYASETEAGRLAINFIESLVAKSGGRELLFDMPADDLKRMPAHVRQSLLTSLDTQGYDTRYVLKSRAGQRHTVQAETNSGLGPFPDKLDSLQASKQLTTSDKAFDATKVELPSPPEDTIDAQARYRFADLEKIRAYLQDAKDELEQTESGRQLVEMLSNDLALDDPDTPTETVWLDQGIQDVAVDQIDIGDMSHVNDPGDFHKVSCDQMVKGFEKLDQVVRPAVEKGAGSDYFREMDQQEGLDYEHGYQRLYDAFYGSDSIRLNKDENGYAVVNGAHRLFVAQQKGIEAVPARVIEKQRKCCGYDCLLTKDHRELPPHFDLPTYVANKCNEAGMTSTVRGTLVHRVTELRSLFQHPDEILSGNRMVEQKMDMLRDGKWYHPEIDQVILRGDKHRILDYKPVHLDEFERTPIGQKWSDWMERELGKDFRQKIKNGHNNPFVRGMPKDIRQGLRDFLRDETRKHINQMEGYRQAYIRAFQVDPDKVRAQVRPYYLFSS